LSLGAKIFLEDPKAAKTESSASKAGIPGPIHLVRRGDYLCVSWYMIITDLAGGIIREYEENRRMLIEQQAVIATMPVKEGFGYDHPPMPSVSSSRSHADSPAASLGKPKRRKTPEYTDSEEESS
jgi:chromodomain-helicase-DNA-binding protein 1